MRTNHIFQAILSNVTALWASGEFDGIAGDKHRKLRTDQTEAIMVDLEELRIRLLKAKQVNRLLRKQLRWEESMRHDAGKDVDEIIKSLDEVNIQANRIHDRRLSGNISGQVDQIWEKLEALPLWPHTKEVSNEEP